MDMDMDVDVDIYGCMNVDMFIGDIEVDVK